MAASKVVWFAQVEEGGACAAHAGDKLGERKGGRDFPGFVVAVEVYGGEVLDRC